MLSSGSLLELAPSSLLAPAFEHETFILTFAQVDCPAANFSEVRPACKVRLVCPDPVHPTPSFRQLLQAVQSAQLVKFVRSVHIVLFVWSVQLVWSVWSVVCASCLVSPARPVRPVRSSCLVRPALPVRPVCPVRPYHPGRPIRPASPVRPVRTAPSFR